MHWTVTAWRGCILISASWRSVPGRLSAKLTTEGRCGMPKPNPIAERTARLKAARLARERYYPPATHAYPVHGLLDALPFGKHRGKVLRDVIR